MSISADVKEAVVESGAAATILTDSGNVTGNYLKYDLNAQVTKPFIREYFIEAMLPYDFPASSGDILQIDTTGLVYLLISKTPKSFENEVIYYSAVLYKSNVTVDILRPTEEDWPTQTYHKFTDWSTVKDDVYALITDPLFGTDIETDEELGVFGIVKKEFYIPSSVGVMENDRVRISLNEYYRVRSVLGNRFDGIDVCILDEDNRVTDALLDESGDPILDPNGNPIYVG